MTALIYKEAAHPTKAIEAGTLSSFPINEKISPYAKSTASQQGLELAATETPTVGAAWPPGTA